MPEPTELHRDEREVARPIPTTLSYEYIVACDQSEVAFLQIVSG